LPMIWTRLLKAKPAAGR